MEFEIWHVYNQVQDGHIGRSGIGGVTLRLACPCVDAHQVAQHVSHISIHTITLDGASRIQFRCWISQTQPSTSSGPLR